MLYYPRKETDVLLWDEQKTKGGIIRNYGLQGSADGAERMCWKAISATGSGTDIGAGTAYSALL